MQRRGKGKARKRKRKRKEEKGGRGGNGKIGVKRVREDKKRKNWCRGKIEEMCMREWKRGKKRGEKRNRGEKSRRKV